MTFWDGTQWVPEAASPPRQSRAATWAASAVMVIGLIALIAPLSLIAAASHRHAAGVAVACDPSPCSPGGSLTVTGWGLTPSAGGQQVFVWLGYPDDYCGEQGCHGVYFDPWVASDGTFSQTFTNVLVCVGTGEVTAFGYLPRPDKWSEVAGTTYSVR